MLTALIFAIAIGPQAQKAQLAPFSPPPMHCVVTAEEIDKPNTTYNYKGIRYVTCCPGCKAPFTKDPEAVLKTAKTKGQMVGISMFDVTTGAAIAGKTAQASSDFEGVRYYFASPEGKKAFEADPKKMSAKPEKELVFCPIMGHALKTTNESGGYVDFKGVRYYACCGDCLKEMKKDPAAVAAKYADKAVLAVAAEEPAKAADK